MSAVFCIVTLEFSSFYIAGSREIFVPWSSDGCGFATNRKCVNVGCRMWHDADVEISLGRYGDFSHPTEPRFDALLETPRKKVLLFDANHPELMSAETDTLETRIRIWTNHASEPDNVVVVVGE